MCGIFGALDVSKKGVPDKQLVLDAMGQLSHRGPDEWGIFCSSEIILGHTRLAIVDVSSGHQPMVRDELVISFNGEIYNHLELREELAAKGMLFSTMSDTEVILRAYQYYGVSCFSLFNGQFSILLWDGKEKRLVVGRDRFGIRPLYTLIHNGIVYFSSEMKAFDRLGDFQRRFNVENLFEHALLWNTLSDSTVYEQIRSVESGTVEVFTADGGHSVRRYYQVGESHEQQEIEFSFATDQFENLLTKASMLRLRSDVPVGAYLSGGIDSTVISQIVKAENRKRFNTFSVSFDDETLDESYYQNVASRSIASNHYPITVTGADIAENILSTIRHTERPIFRTAPVPLHMLSRTVTENDMKVVLTGEGADEILFGYDTFKELKILETWKREGSGSSVVESIKQLYPHLAHYADPKRYGLMKMYYEAFLPDFENDLVGLNIRISNNKIIGKYFNKDWGLEFNRERVLEKVKAMLPANFADWSLLQKNSFLEIKTLLQGYLLSSQGDRMSLSHGVEGRYPFLDHNVVEFVFSLPDEYKLNGFDQKYILKKTFQNRIPDEIINRPKRPYMAPDLAAFVHRDGGMTDVAAEFLSEEVLNDYGLFDVKMVQRFLRKFRGGVPENTGYRDNMIFIFILSAQLCRYWIDNVERATLDPAKCMVDIAE